MKTNLAICTWFLMTDLWLLQAQLKHNIWKIWPLLGNTVKSWSWCGKTWNSHNILMKVQWPEGKKKISLLCPYHVCATLKKNHCSKNCAIESSHTWSFIRLQYTGHRCHLIMYWYTCLNMSLLSLGIQQKFRYNYNQDFKHLVMYIYSICVITAFW